MTMLQQHELAIHIVKIAGLLSLPVTYVALYFAIRWADRKERQGQR